MESTILTNVSIQELRDLISETVRKELEIFLPIPKHELELLTRKEVAEILSVSLVSLNEWTKRGLIPSYRIGSRIRYKKIDIIESLKKVQTFNKYRRGKDC